MNRHIPFIRIASVVVYLVALVSFAPRATAHVVPKVAASVPAAAPAADPGIVTFLRDVPDLRGLISPGDSWTIGGGYLYWAQCRPPGPNIVSHAAAAQPTAGEIGYLRRWPIRGGRAVTLSNTAFCATASWVADDSGLYYWQDGLIYRRSLAAALTPVAVIDTGVYGVAGAMALDSQFLFYILGNEFIYRTPKAQIYHPDDPRYDETEAVVEGGTGATGLIVNGDDLNWFGSGRVRSAAHTCTYPDSCSITDLAIEPGAYLSNASIANYGGLSLYSTPLWVQGNRIRAYSCNFTPTGSRCDAHTAYTAPVPPNSGGTEIGPLASDGTYLFWVENSSDVCGPFGCSFGDHGRLMKYHVGWSAIGSSDPFDTPQPIATQNSSGVFAISGHPGAVAVADGWVYFDTSNGLSRIRADAPPISWDLAFNGWEVTQGIQNLANDVPLVANKPTYVRVYGSKLSGPSAFGVEAILRGTDGNGASLGTLRAINGAQNFTATNGTPDRANAQGGWLFQVPDSWVSAGTLNLRVQIDPRGVWNDPNRGNNTSSTQPFTFTRKAPICIVTVPVRTHAPAASTSDPSLFRMADVTRQMLPTNDVWIYHQDDDVAQLEARFGIPPWKYEPYAVPEKKDTILRALWLRDALSDDPDQCDDAGAVTHYVGLVHAATNTKGNLGYGERPGADLYIKLIDQATLDTTPLFWQNQVFNTLAHELSHNYGRQHVNCGSPANPDPNYPYRDSNGTNCVLDDGLRGGPLFPIPAYNRYYGFDTQNLTPIDPGTTMDYMAYGAPFWISDYTWRALFGSISTNAVNVATRQNASTQAQTEIAAATNVVYLSGAVDPAANAGSLDYAWVYPTAGMSQGMRAKLQRHAAPRTTNPTLQQAGPYTLRLRDAAGALLDERTVTLQETSDGDGTTQPFVMTLPAPVAPVAKLELLSGTTVLATLQPGGAAPTLSILSPVGGATVDDQLTLAWRASDPDQTDRLLFSVQYSPDNGLHWRTMLTNLPNRSGTDTVTLSLNGLSGIPASTTGGLIRVAASDGYHTTLATSPPFTVVNRAPVPIISAPGTAPLPAGQTIVLHGSATDVEDGGLDGDSLRWTLDGADIGSGQTQTIAGLAPGDHTLTLTARDGAGKDATATHTLTVAPLVIPKVATPVFDGDCTDDAYASAARVPLAPYADGTQAFVALARTDDALYACFVGMQRTGGSSPGTLAGVRVDTDHSRDTQPQPGDYLAVMGEDGVITTYAGTGSGYVTPGPNGVSGQVSANATTWNAELRIDASTIGGMNHVVGIDVEQAWVTAVGDDYVWPHTATWDNPSTWATAALGDVPQISDVAPVRAPVGAGDTAITVNGSGFAAGATVQFNGAALATTVISDTQVQATIPAASLGTAGTFDITAVNPGLEAAPSNGLPFSVTNPVPHLVQARLHGSTLTLSGTSFAAGATVQVNGTDYPASGTGTQISVTVSATDLVGIDVAPVTVYNPGPGGGVSNVVTLDTPYLYLPLVLR